MGKLFYLLKLWTSYNAVATDLIKVSVYQFDIIILERQTKEKFQNILIFKK